MQKLCFHGLCLLVIFACLNSACSIQNADLDREAFGRIHFLTPQSLGQHNCNMGKNAEGNIKLRYAINRHSEVIDFSVKEDTVQSADVLDCLKKEISKIDYRDVSELSKDSRFIVKRDFLFFAR